MNNDDLETKYDFSFCQGATNFLTFIIWYCLYDVSNII